jgi:flagellar biogenesis protein FliO
MVLVLLLVIALAYLTLNVGLRRLMRLHRTGGPAGELVTVLARIPVEPKRSLLVVKAAGEYLLLGSAESGLGLISKLDAQEVERMLKEQGAGPVVPAGAFLQKLIARSRGGPPPPSA